MLFGYKKNTDGTYAVNLYEEYAQLLQKWNKVHNLTGAKNIDEIQKNIDDSLYPKGLLKDAKEVVDIGSGAGFPGLVLAMVYPQINFTLTEPIKKKASFLKNAARSLKLANVNVQSCRIEQLDKKFDFVVSRAVAPTQILLRLAQNVVSTDTRYLFYKGDEVEAEIKDLDINYEILKKDKRSYLFIKEING